MANESSKDLEKFLEQVPEPDVVRERLGENLREARFLRRLLKLAKERREIKDLSNQEAATCR